MSRRLNAAEAKAGPTVLLADDNPGVLATTRSVLETKFQVVAALTRAEEVVAAVKKLRPDVVVLDISFGSASGIDLAQQLRRSGCRVIFLTVHEDDDFVRAAFAAGAIGYVTKTNLTCDLPLAIDAATEGRMFVSTVTH